MTITDSKRKTEVFTFLTMVSNSDEMFTTEEYEEMKFTAPEIAEWLTQVDCHCEVPELNLELLREQITWARKSHTVKDEFAQCGWKQEVWLTGELPGKPVPVKSGDGMVLGYVAEDFCNTAGCIAGSVALRNGDPLWQENGDGTFGAHSMADGLGIDEFARRELGLTHREARVMFDEHCPIDFLETMAEGVCLRRGLEY